MPTVVEYTTKVKQDGVIHELHFPAIEIPRCQTCGELFVTSAVDEQINEALRARLRLLSPAQMRRSIEKLGLKQQELAERLGVAPETISRWLNGALIQSRAMDNLLRLFFALPDVRDVLPGGSQQDPHLGSEVHERADSGQQYMASEDCLRVRIEASSRRYPFATRAYGEDGLRVEAARIRGRGCVLPMGQE
jgi:putative zinc finger/helix-turn-helix YgiT family protein